MLGLFRRRPRHRVHPWDLDCPLIRLGERDIVTNGDAMEGTLILGGPGSGKSSGSAFQLACGMLANGFGGVVNTVKVDEADRWRKLCRIMGREADLIVFDESEGHQFGFLDYLIERQGKGSGLTENIIYLLEEMADIGERANGTPSRGDERYWSCSRREMARNAIDLLTIIMGRLSPNFIMEIVRDAPRSLAEANTADWRSQSLIGQLLERGRNMSLSPAERHDLEQTRHYFTSTLPALAEKTRSIIESSLSGVLDPFSRGKLHRLYCQGTTVTPDDVIAGKIVVINQPIKRDFTVGLFSQAIWKTLFQLRVEQRGAREDRPCFLFADEAQNLFSVRDLHFLATARSSRVANVWLTQNLPNIFVALGGDESGRAAADSILGLAQNKIFHQNACPVTNHWAAELIGRRKIRLRNSGISIPPFDPTRYLPEEPTVSSGSSETFEFLVQPHVFTTLRKGGRHGRTEAIFFQGGRQWAGSRENYLRVEFRQGL